MNTPLKKFHGTKTPGEFRSIVFGDVHINHQNTTAKETIPVLYEIVKVDAEFVKLDMIFIEGDFFDSLMYFNNIFLKRIVQWILHLLKLCAKYNIALRVLEGTPSHDMKQPECFAYYNELYSMGADVLYVDDLKIERNTKLGVDILYLPDEWDSPLENCYKAAKNAIKALGETQVDYVVMHGNFEYQLPKVAGLAAHSSKLWQELVRYNILIGHVHTHSTYGKIVATGSTNRLRHGEESPKGWCSVIGYSDGTTNVTFIENKNAKTYTTLKVPNNLDTEETISYITEHCENLRPDSYIKFAHEDNITLTGMLNYARMEYPDINFSIKKLEGDETTKTRSVLPVIKAREGIDITKDNLHKLMGTELTNRGMSDADITDALDLLKGIVDEL